MDYGRLSVSVVHIAGGAVWRRRGIGSSGGGGMDIRGYEVNDKAYESMLALC